MVETQPARLLIVDDEAPQMKALSSTLQDEGYHTLGFTSPHEALATLRRQRFDLLVTDLMMPGMDGLSLLRAALELDGDLVVILMTGQGTISTAVEAMKAGAIDYILKPFKLSAILPVLDRALAMRRLRQENVALSRRVAERSAELEAANRELEAFSYSISHDLRSPLRHMDGYARLLVSDFSQELPPEARRYLDVIMGGAQRMGQLIDDLLRFSRLGRQSITLQPLDLAVMVRQILEDLRRENPEREVAVKVGDLPPCAGDAPLIKQVLINLLSNAFKFTRKKEGAGIEVGSMLEKDETVYFVRDNGAGFDMQYGKMLFGVFQRLHRTEEFEGTGIGLSIVKRVIQRHGGRIWAQAAVNEGATFYFTLPGFAA